MGGGRVIFYDKNAAIVCKLCLKYDLSIPNEVFGFEQPVLDAIIQYNEPAFLTVHIRDSHSQRRNARIFFYQYTSAFPQFSKNISSRKSVSVD